jgi:hypothetical protein
MVKDIYAIYESYVTKETVNVGYASANDTERGNVNLQYRPIAQNSTFNDLGESDEERSAVATLKGGIKPNPEDTSFSLRGAGVVTASTVRQRLGRLIELMNTKAGQGDYNGLAYMQKDLQFYIQANQEVSEILKNKQ